MEDTDDEVDGVDLFHQVLTKDTRWRAEIVHFGEVVAPGFQRWTEQTYDKPISTQDTIT